MKELRLGDRVRVFESTGLWDGMVVGVYADRTPSIIVEFEIAGSEGFSRTVFREQVRRLIPRKKNGVWVTREMVEKACLDAFITGFPAYAPTAHYLRVEDICRALGLAKEGNNG